MPNINDRAIRQQRIGTIIATHNIDRVANRVGPRDRISSSHQAIVWLEGKLKTAHKHEWGDWGGELITDLGLAGALGAASGAFGGAVGLLGGPVGAIVGGAVGGLVGGGTGVVVGLGTSFYKHASRALKGLYKKGRGTKGVHRHQAAQVLAFDAYFYATSGLKNSKALPAYEAVSAFQPNALEALKLAGKPPRPGQQSMRWDVFVNELAELFRSR